MDGNKDMKKINFYLIEYAIDAIFRQKSRNLFILSVLGLIIFLLSSVFFVRNSLVYELEQAVSSMPQIIVQEQEGGRLISVDESVGDLFFSIEGVEDVVGRVWGYHEFYPARTHFAIVGVDEFEKIPQKSFAQDIQRVKPHSMLIGESVSKVLQKFYYKDYFNFLLQDGKVYKLDISGKLSHNTALWSHDVMLMSKDDARKVLGISEEKVVDFAVFVSNVKEVPTIASKIRTLLPSAKITTKKELDVGYRTLLSYKGGFFLVLFIITLITFFIIIYDKVSGVTSQEKNEVGILKAIGWRVEDILLYKFYEALIIALFAFIIGVVMALIYVYIFHAPLIRDIFVGASSLKVDLALPFIFDIQTFFLVFFVSVPVYIAAIIVPTWRVATLDVDELIR